jgi:hypothetical protein
MGYYRRGGHAASFPHGFSGTLEEAKAKFAETWRVISTVALGQDLVVAIIRPEMKRLPST